MFNVIINSEQYDEFMAQKEKIKELEARNEFLKEQHDSVYADYQQALSDKAALIKERNELSIENEGLKNKSIRFKELVSENYRLQMSNNDLKANNKELKNKNAAIKDKNEALIDVCDRLREKLSAKNDEILDVCGKFNNVLKERDEFKDLYMKQLKESVGMIKIDPYRDLADVYSPDNNMNVKIENLYIANNYFSEEDENNGDE